MVLRWIKWLFVVILLAFAAGWYLVSVPYGPTTETFVDIAPGTGTAAIAEHLQKAGVVRSALAFEAMKTYKQGTLKAGEYRFDHPATLAEVYDRLRSGDVFTVTVVVPEGFNIFDVADAVAAAGLASREDFLAAEVQHVELVKAWEPNATSVEGYLFPDTYKFSRHATPEQMIAAMIRRFAQVATKLSSVSTEASLQRLGPLVTMASLIEKEVHIDAERAHVAGVFQNRLAAGMPLQTDPAVIYASLLRGTWTGVIHQSELKSDSLYNTYTHTGLPPGPICNPGMASLRAAMHPLPTGDLYFVADARGSTRFSQTLQQHNSNVAAYRKGKK